MNKKRLQSFLHENIPLTKDMGLEFIRFNNGKLTAKAPIENNINDKSSVFGGSSSALMIITAWSLIRLKCDELTIDADIVIHKNSTTWHKAMYEDLYIQAEFDNEYDFEKIKSTLTKNRHQRIACKIKLVDTDDVLYSTMQAKYVIIPKK